MRLARRIAALAMAAMLINMGGCLVMPLPARCVSPHGLYSVDQHKPNPVSTFEVGRTTREEVLLSLGPPDRSWNNERLFAYVSDTVKATLEVGIYMMGGPTHNLGCRYTLLIEFDDSGILRRQEFVKSELKPKAAEFSRIMDAFAAGGSGKLD